MTEIRQSNTYKATDLLVKSGVVATAQAIHIDGRPFMIANTGAQPLYINPVATATTANGFLVPAGTVLPIKMTVQDDLSVISNATGTSLAILFFDL